MCFCYVVTCFFLSIFFFKQKTAYEMRISDWSSDVCSSDLLLTAILATSAFPIFALVIAPAALVAVLWAVPLALRAQGNAGTALPVRNPFEVLPALGFAAVVAVMVLASRWAIERFGDSGLATLLALIGLYDVDSGIRSDERRVGKAWVIPCRPSGSPYL